MGAIYFGQKPPWFALKRAIRHSLIALCVLLVFGLGATIGVARYEFVSPPELDRGPSQLLRYEMFLDISEAGIVHVSELYTYDAIASISPNLLRPLPVRRPGAPDETSSAVRYGALRLDLPASILPLAAVLEPSTARIEATWVNQNESILPVFRPQPVDHRGQTQLRVQYHLPDAPNQIRSERKFHYDIRLPRELLAQSLALGISMPPGVVPNIKGYPPEIQPTTVTLIGGRSTMELPLKDISDEYAGTAPNGALRTTVGATVAAIPPDIESIAIVVPLPVHQLGIAAHFGN